MKNSLLLFLIFFLLRPCNAISRDFTFSNINESFGISMREITAAVRDDDGFIWAASRSGVLRVASDDYRLYQLPFATTDVLQLKMASRGSLLVVATQNGQVFRYNRILNKFEQWFTLSSLLGNAYIAIAPLIGGIGCFVTGSATSASVMFATLQQSVAQQLGINEIWLVAANGAGATAGKMISPQSIALGVAAINLPGSDGKIMSKTIGWCVLYLVILCVFCFVGA